MSVRFLADADFNGIIRRAVLRLEPAVDFRSAEHLVGLDDPDVLALAARDRRLLVTHERRTMPDHFAEFVQLNDSSGVVVVLQAMPTSDAALEILLIWTATQPGEWVNRLVVLPW